MTHKTELLLKMFFLLVCNDAWPNCAELALQDKCTEGNMTQFMLTHCRQSCGLCQGKVN